MTQKYSLLVPDVAAPWAATMGDSLGRLLGDDDLGAATLALCQASLQPRPYNTYASTLTSFMTFCHEQNVSPLEVTPVHVARYVAWLGRQGTVAAGSLHPYISAINRFLQDHGRPPVALGPLVADVRAGIKNSQVALQPPPARIPLPALVAADMLAYVEDLVPKLTWVSSRYPRVQ